MSIIHYHGTPVWGDAGEVHRIAVSGAGAFVSYARPDQVEQSFRYASAVAIDNGAFSTWKRNLVIDWTKFYQFLMRYYHRDKLSFFVIPDTVEGGEEENDRLIRQVPAMFREKAVPVWHLHEPIDRLIKLCEQWPKVCFGSSGEYAQVRTERWHKRMHEAFDVIYVQRSFETRVHGLRMLDGRILGKYPLHSADSTNLACNVPKFRSKYPGLGIDKQHRCAILKGAIEKVAPLGIDAWVRLGRDHT